MSVELGRVIMWLESLSGHSTQSTGDYYSAARSYLEELRTRRQREAAVRELQEMVALFVNVCRSNDSPEEDFTKDEWTVFCAMERKLAALSKLEGGQG